MHEKTPAVQTPQETRVLSTLSFPECLCHHFSHTPFLPPSCFIHIHAHIWTQGENVHSRTQAMRSLNFSLGKSGLSRLRKYIFNTPATELMSWLFSSSVKGSLPGKQSLRWERIQDVHMYRWSDDCVHKPRSKEFLMSLTSTCDPETLKIPWCCRPEKNQIIITTWIHTVYMCLMG